MLRFHLDENVHAAVAGALAGRGFDVTTAASAGLLEATDPEHLAFARDQGRVIVTHDADFLRMHATGVDHAGIAYALPDRSLGDLVRGLVLLPSASNRRTCAGTSSLFKPRCVKLLSDSGWRIGDSTQTA